ncbi:hypothetical protein [Helicobacter pylori]|uniref:hypothetical protein n=1 Tax=Helicobacter pylori TaxID=210 RepID=UPI001C572142|nr:hypothetical protein [Helicobacter pylori]
MIDQLQVVPKAQILENHTIRRSLASALQKASIPRSASTHRAPLINHFLEQVILQSPSDGNKKDRKSTRLKECMSYCIDFRARNFERQPLVPLDPKEIKTHILERLKL